MKQPSIKPIRWLAVWGAALALAGSLQAQPAGLWNFDSGDLSATVGSPLQHTGSGAGTSFGTTTSFTIPDIGGTPANVMKFDAGASGGGYRMPVAVAANGGGTFVNNYTVVMDVLFPAASATVRRPLLETDLGLVNTTEGAEFYISTTGELTGLGNARGTIAADTWYRIGIVVDGANNLSRLYINGVEQGSFPAGGIDGRLALNPAGSSDPFAELFKDLAGATALGYVNSVQFRGEALAKGQMQALAGPTAGGIPAVIPDIPSFVESWVPSAALARLSTGLGVVLNPGSSTLTDIAMTLNGNALTVGTSTDGDGNIVVTASGATVSALTDYVLGVTYTDSKAGSKSFTHSFRVPLLYEDFELLTLGSPVEEPGPLANPIFANNAFTHTAPSYPIVGDWTVDRTGVPGYNNPPESNGRAEWIGWSFANKDFWLASDNQSRDQFVKGQGNLAIADPDEWDDATHPGSGVATADRTTQGLWYKTYMTTPQISLAGAAAGTVFLRFDSSWNPEYDDNFHQTGRVRYRFDAGAWQTLFIWESLDTSPNFKPTAYSETLNLLLNNPQGASTLQIEFGMYDAGNDWWWAIDNISVDAGVLPPTITTPPQLTTATEGDDVQLTVVATGEGLSYQWFKGDIATRQPINGATSATLAFTPVALSDDGLYSVRVSNNGGEDFSTPVRLLVLERFGGQITDDLVVHLKFDGDGADSSGRNNNGTPVGSPSFVPGRLGSALRYSSAANGSSFNYVTLGAPADLNFGAGTDFSVSFWSKFSTWAGDPAFIGNKNWNSGGNPGWVIATAGDGRLQWNAAPTRIDYDGPGGTMSGGNWHHVVVTFGRNSVISTYLDGVKVDERAAATAGDWNTPANQATNIGQDGTGTYTDNNSVGIADGTIDDVGIWRRAITADEAKAIYRAGLDGLDLSQAQTAPPVDQDLVAYLGFENNLTDGSGRGNNGTAVGNVPFVAGRVGQGVQVSSLTDGTSFNFVTLGAPADLNFGTTTSFSVAFWAKVNSWAGDPAFISNKDWDSGSSVGWVAATAGDGRIQWNIAGQPDGTTTGNRRDYDSSGGYFNNNAWRHIVIAFQRSAGAGIARTYVDGVLINTTQYAGADNNINTVAGRATNIGQDGVGDYTDGNSVGINAVIDEVMIWRRALSDSEATGVYAAGVLGLAGTEANPDLVVQLPPGAIASSVTGPSMNFQWDARSGVRLQSTPSFSPANWQDVPGTLGLESFTVPIGTADEFFRLFRP